MAATAAERWAQARSFHHSPYPAERIAAEREHSVSVCLPARECSQTLGAIVIELIELRDRGMIDEVVVVAGASADGTAAIAESAGAVVWQEAELMPSHGPVLGRGDAMWRALSALGGELVCFLDPQAEGPVAHRLGGLLGPLVCERDVSFVKAFYTSSCQQQRRATDAHEDGRVNHLMARPALALFYPELAGMREPLAGELAARRELLERLPFASGEELEIAMLIDVWRKLGLQAIAQVDLGERRSRRRADSPTARKVLSAIARRLEQDGRLRGVGEVARERPPLESVRVA